MSAGIKRGRKSGRASVHVSGGDAADGRRSLASGNTLFFHLLYADTPVYLSFPFPTSLVVLEYSAAHLSNEKRWIVCVLRLKRKKSYHLSIARRDCVWRERCVRWRITRWSSRWEGWFCRLVLRLFLEFVSLGQPCPPSSRHEPSRPRLLLHAQLLCK